MPQISRTTNPTGLRRLDSKLFTVRVRTGNAGERTFWLERFDLKASNLPAGLRLSCIAHAGNTEEFFKLGAIDALDHDLKPLENLATGKPLKFRFIVHAANDPLLVAFADGVRAVDEAGLLGSSLVDIEPADLHGAVWKLEIPHDLTAADKPVLLVERQLFTTAQAAANNTWIAVLVMPEVLRQIASAIARKVEALEDPATWMYHWAEFLKGLDAGELAEDADEQSRIDWTDAVVSAFCAKASLRHQMDRATAELNGAS